MAVDYIHLEHYPEIILLQEVGSTDRVSNIDGDSVEVRQGEGREVSLGPDHDLHRFRVFCGINESHLAQVIAIDAEVVEQIHFMHCGRRFVAVGFRCSSTSRDIIIVSLHLPHSGYGEDEFMLACNELSSFIVQYSRYDFLLGGDWNCEENDERFQVVSIPLTLLGVSFRCAAESTRFGRRVSRSIDFFALYGSGLSDLDGGGKLTQVDPPQVLQQSRLGIGSDHECVLLNMAFPSTDGASGRRLCRKLNSSPCKRSLINTAKLREALPQLPPFRQLDVGQQWTVLVDIAHHVSLRCPSMKYRDSQSLKRLCREQRVCSDPAGRLFLTKLILAQRQLERESWCKNVLDKAAQGDFDCIKQVLRQNNRRINTDDAIGQYATHHEFVEAVHSHFTCKYGALPSSHDCQDVLPRPIPCFDEAAPFTEDEVLQSVSKMKANRTSGPSGMTTDFLKALASEDQGPRVT